MQVLERFSAPTREWFTASFEAPTPAQAGAWESIIRGDHTLVVAPTGSGKTLAAFLWAIDRLAARRFSEAADPSTSSNDSAAGGPQEGTRRGAVAGRKKGRAGGRRAGDRGSAARRCRVLYVSPLKALAVDVERNLRSPLTGIARTARRLGLPPPDIEVAVRSGDTPADERRRFARSPADILITTPESLFLLLTSQAREALRGVETVIVDEVHAVAGTKRGAHLALSLERLDALLPRPAQRIGLSATVRPVETVAAFLAGTGPSAAGRRPVGDEGTEHAVPARDEAADRAGGGSTPPAEEPDGSRPGPETVDLATDPPPVTPGAHRPVRVVNPPFAKEFDLQVVVPVEDMGALGTAHDGGLDGLPRFRADPSGDDASAADAAGEGALHEPSVTDDVPDLDADFGDPARRSSIWPHVEERIADLVSEQRSTLVFANSRRLAERLTARLNELWYERHASDDPSDAEPSRPSPAWPPSSTSPSPSSSSIRATGAAPPAEIMAQAGTAGGAPPVLARAHHGSVSKEQRSLIENDLKSGRLRCVVATSSLELGIDMGAVDLVVQVEAPPSVASGLQRVGRAGHQVGAVSRGVIFPKYRGDLIATAVVAERMRAGLIEEIKIPANPLDVLAQQVVAAVSVDTWDVDELYNLVRGATPFATLPRSAYEAVLDMLAGRYPSDEFAELRPRLVWDRVAGTLKGRPGAQRLAVTSGGTIPDRGLFGVFLVGEGGSRVGELDEEMVYESRVGDVFTLGASSWRIEDITHDRVLVSPAPGLPGKLPFWKGDTLGRPAELGTAIGAFVREVASLDPDAAHTRARRAGLDDRAAANLVDYLAEQKEATRHVPSDRTIVVERFRDELGDWRVCVHSPFGAAVHAPWALAIAGRLRERYGLDVQAIHADDGIVLRIPDTEDDPPAADLVAFDPDEIEQIVTEEVGTSALFASRFRECAARALLLPRRNPGRRAPLWQQRQRSAQLLAVASKYGSFPIVLEAVRECLRDVYDLPGLVDVLRRIASRRIRVVEVETTEPSPFAKSLTFGYIAAFMYEGDAPLAERKAAALALDQSLLAELLGHTELRDLLDPGVVARTEAELQRLTPERRCRDVEGVADLLRLLGPLSAHEVALRAEDPTKVPQWLAELQAARRVIAYRPPGLARPAGDPTTAVGDDTLMWAVIEDAGRLRDALGVPLPVGVPEAFLEPVEDPLGDLIGRYARTHGPFQAHHVAERFGLGTAVVLDVLRRLAAQGRVAEGEFSAGQSGTEWCDTTVLRTIRRRSLAALRQEVEPVEPVRLARFLTDWQHVGAVQTAGDQGVRALPGVVRQSEPRERGLEGVLRVVEQLAGCAVPASALEPLVLRSRVLDYSPAMLDELTTSGEVLWAGHGALPGTDGWVSLHLADSAELTLPEPDPEFEPGPLHQAILDVLSTGGAYFFRQLSDATGSTDDTELASALWDLVWAGRLTTDTPAPLRALLGGGRSTHRTRRPSPRARLGGVRPGLRPRMPSRSGPPIATGRWSLLPEVETDPTRRAHAMAETLLDRYGIVTRGAVAAERVPGGFAAVYRVLSAFEESGRCRRGYFVAGLGAAQFGVPGAVDRLRAASGGDDEQEGTRTVVLAATDPANPYGAALPWPEQPSDPASGSRGHRPGRKAGALVVLVNGELVLYVERGGKSLLSWTEDPRLLQPAADALALAVRDGVLGRLTVERTDGTGVLQPGEPGPVAAALARAGFHATPKGLRLRA